MQKYFSRFRSLFRAALLFAGILFLFSCSAGESAGEDLFLRIADRDADFTVIFPPASDSGEEVVASAEKRGDRITLTVYKPEDAPDLILTVRREPSGEFSSSMTIPGAPDSSRGAEGVRREEEIIPAPAASRALTDPFALLWGFRDLPAEAPPSDSPPEPESEDEAASFLPVLLPVRRLEDEILLTGTRGTLVLNEEGLPVRAVCRDLGGNWRTVRFEDYTFAPSP